MRKNILSKNVQLELISIVKVPFPKYAFEKETLQIYQNICEHHY